MSQVRAESTRRAGGCPPPVFPTQPAYERRFTPMRERRGPRANDGRVLDGQLLLLLEDGQKVGYSAQEKRAHSRSVQKAVVRNP